MKRKRLIAVVAACTAIVGGVAALSQIGGAPPKAEASDHDDGELDLKSRALNLTDHFAFKSPADPNVLTLIMYVNPRSLPGRQYFLSTNARYEFHITRVTGAKTAQPMPKDDIVIRLEASAPTSAGTQFITMTMIKDNVVTHTHIGTSTSFAASRAGGFGATAPGNSTVTEGQTIRYFVGMRADSFFFDVNRFFQVRAFLAQRFFGGPGNIGDASASLAANCEGDAFLAGAGDLDGDSINLFNPPSCAPDFTKNLNVTAIVVNVPKVLLGTGDVFDTWSTISVLQ